MSSTLGAFILTDENRASIEAERKRISPTYGCPICGVDIGLREKKVWWLSPDGIFAHTVCYDQVKEYDAVLAMYILKVINTNSIFQNGAHRWAVGHIRSACGSDSLASYQKKYGAPALKHLFNTAGIQGVKDFVADALKEFNLLGVSFPELSEAARRLQ